MSTTPEGEHSERQSRSQLRIVMLGVPRMLDALSSSAHGRGMRGPNGDHWTRSTERQKRMYLVGIANILRVEAACGWKEEGSDKKRVIVRQIIAALDAKDLDSVREELDDWYAADPRRQEQSIIEALWFELVLPGIR